MKHAFVSGVEERSSSRSSVPSTMSKAIVLAKEEGCSTFSVLGEPHPESNGLANAGLIGLMDSEISLGIDVRYVGPERLVPHSSLSDKGAWESSFHGVRVITIGPEGLSEEEAARVLNSHNHDNPRLTIASGGRRFCGWVNGGTYENKTVPVFMRGTEGVRWEINHFPGPELPHLVQCGPLIPADWESSGLEVGKVVIWDDSSLQIDFLTVPGPRFFRVRIGELWTFLRCTEGLRRGGADSIYVRVSVDSEFLEEAQVTLSKLRAQGVVDGGYVHALSSESIDDCYWE